jgi:zinc transport system permease protein
MMEFFGDLARFSFLQQALVAGVIAGIACGVVGSYVVARRITYVTGGVAHCTLGGMGAARYLNQVHGWERVEPLHGAVVAALIAAVIIGWVSLRAREREDTVISALWAIGMAVGILFIAKTPGYYEDLMSYLFGNILLVSRENLFLMAALDVVVVGVAVLFYNRFLAVCFDEEFARLRGINVEFYYLVLLCLTALTVVILVTVVGLVMVIALLTLPIAIANHFASRMWHVMLAGAAISICLTTGGLVISYGPELPVGATTIVLAGVVYLIVILVPHMADRRKPA